jgi:hypothetical protein
MRLALGEPLPPSVAAPDQPADLVNRSSLAASIYWHICRWIPK